MMEGEEVESKPAFVFRTSSPAARKSRAAARQEEERQPAPSQRRRPAMVSAEADIDRMLWTEAEVSVRVGEVAAELAADLRARPEPAVVVGVATGAFLFGALSPAARKLRASPQAPSSSVPRPPSTKRNKSSSTQQPPWREEEQQQPWQALLVPTTPAKCLMKCQQEKEEGEIGDINMEDVLV